MNDTHWWFIASVDHDLHRFMIQHPCHPDNTVQREFGNLERIPDNYPKVVLSMDEVGPDQRNGIRQQHLVQFLLEE